MRTVKFVVFVTLFLAGTASWADVRMSAQQIQATIVGNTLTVITQALKEAQGYFEADGSVKGRIGSEDFAGHWRISQDELCLDLPIYDHEVCRRIVSRGDLLLMFTSTGQPAGRINVEKGNPGGY